MKIITTWFPANSKYINGWYTQQIYHEGSKVKDFEKKWWLRIFSYETLKHYDLEINL